MSSYVEKNYSHNSSITLSRDPRREFSLFAQGYFHAASKLADDFLFHDHADSYYDIYPIVFLYRHSLELCLKQILFDAALLVEFKTIENLEKKLSHNHDLILLRTAFQFKIAFLQLPDHRRE